MPVSQDAAASTSVAAGTWYEFTVNTLYRAMMGRFTMVYTAQDSDESSSINAPLRK